MIPLVQVSSTRFYWWIMLEESTLSTNKETVVQSLLDDYGLLEVSEAAEAVRKAVEEQSFLKATELWSVAESVIEQVG